VSPARQAERLQASQRLASAGAYPDHMTIAELCAVIDYTPRAIGRWIAEGLITVNRYPGRRVRIPVKGLDFLPPFGELLITPETARSMTGYTKGQLWYARTVSETARAIRMPGGQNRYYISAIRAIVAEQKKKGAAL
jgi:hypothetical protein